MVNFWKHVFPNNMKYNINMCVRVRFGKKEMIQFMFASFAFDPVMVVSAYWSTSVYIAMCVIQNQHASFYI